MVEDHKLGILTGLLQVLGKRGVVWGQVKVLRKLQQDVLLHGGTENNTISSGEFCLVQQRISLVDKRIQTRMQHL